MAKQKSSRGLHNSLQLRLAGWKKAATSPRTPKHLRASIRANIRGLENRIRKQQNRREAKAQENEVESKAQEGVAGTKIQEGATGSSFFDPGSVFDRIGRAISKRGQENAEGS
jgi:predicted component of type VI protein secretion system